MLISIIYIILLHIIIFLLVLLLIALSRQGLTLSHTHPVPPPRLPSPPFLGRGVTLIDVQLSVVQQPRGRRRNSDLHFTFYDTFLDGCRVTKQNVCGSSHQDNRSQNMDTLHMLTEPIRKANARRLQEETNGLIEEFIYANLL